MIFKYGTVKKKEEKSLKYEGQTIPKYYSINHIKWKKIMDLHEKLPIYTWKMGIVNIAKYK